jgi:hypothetical protein
VQSQSRLTRLTSIAITTTNTTASWPSPGFPRPHPRMYGGVARARARVDGARTEIRVRAPTSTTITRHASTQMAGGGCVARARARVDGARAVARVRAPAAARARAGRAGALGDVGPLVRGAFYSFTVTREVGREIKGERVIARAYRYAVRPLTLDALMPLPLTLMRAYYAHSHSLTLTHLLTHAHSLTHSSPSSTRGCGRSGSTSA